MIRELTDVQRYALQLIIDGATSHAEDDLNEDGAISDQDHTEAVELALAITRAIRRYSHVLLELTEENSP